MTKYPCGICTKCVKTNQKAVFCDYCLHWVHIKCDTISGLEYEDLKLKGVLRSKSIF